MVKGLDLFREHFGAFADHYVLIGGTACDLILNEAGLPFRATRDLDIVLCVETLDAAFAQAFWQFVHAGRYQLQESATGEKKFYRFQKPDDDAYPAMLELFSRKPDALSLPGDSRLTPIPIDEEIASLSAILLEDDYYGWILSGKREIDGVRIVGPEHLVPLKARAWLDLRDRKNAGHQIDSRSIKKHRNDVFRLFQVLDPETNLQVPGPIARDMRAFLELAAHEGVDLKALGFGTTSFDLVIDVLGQLYSID